MPHQRGTITTKDSAQATTTDECVQLVRNWAEGVYRAWDENHAVISEIADGFLTKENLD